MSPKDTLSNCQDYKYSLEEATALPLTSILLMQIPVAVVLLEVRFAELLIAPDPVQVLLPFDPEPVFARLAPEN